MNVDSYSIDNGFTGFEQGIGVMFKLLQKHHYEKQIISTP